MVCLLKSIFLKSWWQIISGAIIQTDKKNKKKSKVIKKWECNHVRRYDLPLYLEWSWDRGSDSRSWVGFLRCGSWTDISPWRGGKRERENDTLLCALGISACEADTKAQPRITFPLYPQAFLYVKLTFYIFFTHILNRFLSIHITISFSFSY